jgi:hypothetical protein
MDEEEVFEIALCEQESLILRPGVLYRLTPILGCVRCTALAAAAEIKPSTRSVWVNGQYIGQDSSDSDTI